MGTDYYAILGVPQNATSAQIRSRFLELARTHHPDRVQGEGKTEAEEAFQAITQAFNILSDADRRREVDAQLVGAEVDPVKDQDQAAKVYLSRGIKAYRAGNYVEAADNFERATKQDPRDARAWSYLAQACRHQRRWGSRARKAAAKACQLEPMNATYLKLAGRLFAHAEMFARAEKYYVAAQNWGGDDPEIEKALADVRRGQKKSRGGLFGRDG